MNKKLVWLCLGMIVVVAGVLRIWNLGEVPFGRDEFLDINATVGFAQTGAWQAWDHNLGQVSTRINPASDARAWVYRWQVAQIFGFLPPIEAVARAVSVAWGILGVALVYLVGASLTRRREIGLISAAVFALSINAIEIDRTLRMYAMFAPVFLAFGWSVWLAMERVPTGKFGKKFAQITGIHIEYALIALALGVLSLHLHLLTVNIVFVLVVYWLVMSAVCVRVNLRKSINWWRSKYLAWLSILAVAGLATAAIKPQVFAQFGAGLKFWENHYGYINIVLADFAHPLIGLALIIGGAWALVRAGRVREGVWLASMVGVILAAAVLLWNRVVGEQYIFFIVPFVSILVGSGIYYCANYLSSQLYGRNVFGWVLVGALVFVPNYGYFFTENNTYGITSRADAPDYRKVFTYVKKHKLSDDVLVTRNFRNYYWSGASMKTFDFGSERPDELLAREGKMRKVTRGHIAQIVADNQSGWVVFADNDEKFITKEARTWMTENLTRISHPNIRGKITVYRWGIN